MPRASSADCAGLTWSACSTRNLAPIAARNYRKLRDLGVTVRKTADVIIGTFCIERRCALLHDDRDFLPMQQHLGLVTA